MYVRFQAPDGEGLFAITYDLKWPGRLSRHDRRRVERLTEWFDVQLPAVPEAVFDRAGEGRVRCWFRAAACEHLEMAWELEGVLESLGREVRMERATDPGPVVFQDRAQVAVLLARPVADVPRDAWNGDRSTIRGWHRDGCCRCGW
jgi:hypothetical protein